MNTLIRSTFTAATLFAVAALAHGSEQHLKGVIQKVDATQITLAPEKGEPVTVNIDDKTKFEMGDAAASVKDVAAGQRAVIHATRHAGALLAITVKLPPAEKKAAGDAGPTKIRHAHQH